MKRLLYRGITSCLLSMVVTMACSFTCSAQNGPSTPSVKLTWANTAAPSGQTLAINNLYRCTGASCTPAPPAIFTSASPVLTFTDNAVSAGTSYNYAVTESTEVTGTTTPLTESGYSNIALAAIPTAPGAPTLGTPATTGKNDMPAKDGTTVAKSDGPPAPPTNVTAVVHKVGPTNLTVAITAPGTK